MRKIIAWLDSEDLARGQRNHARLQLALAGHPALSIEEAEQAILEDLRLIREWRQKYDISPEEAVEFSLYDGAILESSE